MNLLRRFSALCLASLALAACQPVDFVPAPAALVTADGLVFEDVDGGDVSVTITPMVSEGRRVLGAVVTPPYTLSQIDRVEVSLSRVDGAQAGLRKAGEIAGNPTGKTVKLGKLRPSATYRLVFVAKDVNGTVLSEANQGVDITIDVDGVVTLGGTATVQLIGAVRPANDVTFPGFEITELGTPVKGYVTAYGDNLTAAPGGLVFGPDGALYIATASGIEKLNPDGTRDATFAVTGLSAPTDVDISGSTLYIADAGNDRIATAPIAGGAATAFGVPVRTPASVAVGPDGLVYVSTGKRVARLNAAGELGTFLSAETIAYPDIAGQLISGDSADIREFNFGKIAAGAATVSPGGLSFDPRGNLHVVDRGRKGIWKVTPAGVATKTQAVIASGAIDVVFGTDSRTYLVGADKKLYTSDYGGEAVLLAGGGAAGAVPAFGKAAGFAGVAGITQDADGFVYVAETGATPRIRKVH